ncbi:hypothetical protein E2C01_083549 [Portunus trituberculatus]|uniref:Uncharacterized protein n=1 Tax=Portunus trituberculatus TaxID=210409 RepID=A0A5B7J2E1_PORTR|nr:hypothetical protein [Portunus trituberculatus]
MEDSTLWSPDLEEKKEEEEEEELLMLFWALNNKRKKNWVYEANMKQLECGEYHHLIQELEMDEEKFQQYFRLTPAQFSEILSFIEQDVKKQGTNYRKSISSW